MLNKIAWLFLDIIISNFLLDFRKHTRKIAEKTITKAKELSIKLNTSLEMFWVSLVGK